MDGQSDLYQQALRIINKHGAGSDEYANFLSKNATQDGYLPHGVTLPRYVPGDVRNLRKKKSRRSRGRSMSTISDVSRGLERTASSCGSSCLELGHVRTVSETLFIQGLEPVVVTRPESVQEELELKASCEGSVQVSPWMEGEVEEMKQLEEKLKLERTVSGESTDIREVVDQFKAVLHEKAQVEGSLVEAQQTNEVLKQEFDNLKRQHEDMTSVKDTMNEQVSRQLQILLKEKSQLMEQNHQLQAENGNLKVLLDLATEEAESEEENWDREQDFPDSIMNPSQEISAWHPFETQERQMGDKQNLIDERVIGGAPQESVTRKFDRISIST